MAKNKKGFTRIFLLMIGLYSLAPLSFFTMPFADFEKEGIQRIMAYMSGGLFWFGAIFGSVCLTALNIIRKKECHGKKINGVPGIFRFFSCKQGKIMDMLFGIFLLISIMFTAIKAVPQAISLISYGIMLFFGIMHSAFNGKNFKYLKNRKNLYQ